MITIKKESMAVKMPDGEYKQFDCIKGDKGDTYVLTEEDKQEIADVVLTSLVDGDNVEF